MSDVSSVVRHFSISNEGFLATLSSPITAGAATVPLNSVTGLTTGSVFVGIVEPGVLNKQQVFTGTVDTPSTSIVNCKWTRGINVDHANGAAVVDYVTGTDHNMTTKGVLVQHNQDGSHNNITASSLTAASVTTSTLTINGRDSSQLTPSGIMSPFAGPTAPTGWLLCDGAAVSRATYVTLFAVVGTYWGAGDGSTTFNVPNAKGRMFTGLDSSQTEFAALGQVGGQKTVQLHSHGVSDPGHAHGVSDPGHNHDNLGGIHAGGGGADWDVNSAAANRSVSLNWSDGTRNGASGAGIGINGAGTNVSIANAGAGVNNLSPYLVANYIIKV